jgi:lipopolysaccharide/colanic/teichoic acid biosynthesis glycosyltransferase
MTALEAAELFGGIVPLEMATEELLMQASVASLMPSMARVKRVFDIGISILACVVLFVPAILIAVLVKLTSPRGPVFYVQTRVGRFGECFSMVKFRTMRPGAEDGTGPVWSERGDSRVTALGRFLRRTRLDEIPQFLTVLKGDMSIVGPRPERPEFVEDLRVKLPFYDERHNVLPGITGWAQIRYPYGDTIEDARRKLEFDLYYIKHQSMALDLQVLLSTIRIVIFGMER